MTASATPTIVKLPMVTATVPLSRYLRCYMPSSYSP